MTTSIFGCGLRAIFVGLYVGCAPGGGIPAANQSVHSGFDPCQTPLSYDSMCDGTVRMTIRREAGLDLCANWARYLCIRPHAAESEVVYIPIDEPKVVRQRTRMRADPVRCHESGLSSFRGTPLEVELDVRTDDAGDAVATVRGPNTTHWCGATRDLLRMVSTGFPRTVQTPDPEAPIERRTQRPPR